MTRNSQTFTFKASAKWMPPAMQQRLQRVLGRLLGFHEFNAFYAALPPCTAAGFPEKFLEAMSINVVVDGMPADTIPATGPLIVVANHPFGFVEGLALDALLLRRRPDVTMMSIYIFGTIPELQERYTFVDPAKSRRRKNLNPQGWRQSLLWLKRGGVLGIFPAGGVARFQCSRMRTTDRTWSPHIAAIARRTKTPVLPVWFHGSNNWWFHLAGILHPRLQDLLFVREIMNKRGRTLRATIGPVIGPGQLARFASVSEATAFLRNETEKLARLESVP